MKLNLVNALLQVGKARAEMDPLACSIMHLKAHELEELHRTLCSGPNPNAIGYDVQSMAKAAAMLIVTGGEE
jgi:hypothetical protein